MGFIWLKERLSEGGVLAQLLSLHRSASSVKTNLVRGVLRAGMEVSVIVQHHRRCYPSTAIVSVTGEDNAPKC